DRAGAEGFPLSALVAVEPRFLAQDHETVHRGEILDRHAREGAVRRDWGQLGPFFRVGGEEGDAAGQIEPVLLALEGVVAMVEPTADGVEAVAAVDMAEPRAEARVVAAGI